MGNKNLRFFPFMPVPSASSKIIFTMFKCFWPCSICFEHSQIFWSWSKARFYFIYLHIWAWSKIFGFIQKILNTVKSIMNMVKNNWTSRWIRHKWIWLQNIWLERSNLTNLFFHMKVWISICPNRKIEYSMEYSNIEF